MPTFQTGGFGTSLGVFQIEEGKSATQIVGTHLLADGTPAPTDTVMGDANPEFRMSLTNDLNYKGLGLHVLLDSHARPAAGYVELLAGDAAAAELH